MSMSGTKEPNCTGSKDGFKFRLVVPSLQHITSVKIATCLCMQMDVEQIISSSLNMLNLEVEQNFNSFKRDIYNNIPADSDNDNYEGSTNNSFCESNGDLHYVKISENCTKFMKVVHVAKITVIEKLEELNIPMLMSPFVSGVAKQVLKEVIYWANFQHCLILKWGIYVFSNCLDNLVLSSRGLIDFSTSLRNLISKDLEIRFKYDLACMFCFEDLIEMLKPRVLRLGLTYSYISSINFKLRKFWTHSAMLNKFNKHKYLLKTFMECIDMSANSYALMCLWDKLTKQDKDKLIKIIFNSECDIEFKCYVLSQLDHDQQEVVFAIAAQDLLNSLYLSDLWREMFLPTVHYLEDKISAYILCRVAKEAGVVLKKMCGGYNSHVAIFQELWHLAPENAKKGVIDYGEYVLQLPKFLSPLLSGDFDSGLHCIFKCFSWFKSFDLIMLILQECTPVQRKNILLSRSILHNCGELIEKNEWDLLEKYTGLCLPSTGDMDDFKKRIKGEKIHLNVGKNLMIKMRWVEVDKFLNYISGTEGEKDILREKFALPAFFT